MTGQHRSLSVSIVMVVAVFILPFTTTAQEKPSADPEDQAWNEVYENPPAAAQYLVKYPSGKHASEAKIYVSLKGKLDKIRKNPRSAVVPLDFAALGENWNLWKRWHPETGLIVVTRDLRFKGIASVSMGPVIMKGFKGGSAGFDLFPADMMAFPTGDGSIWGFEKGAKLAGFFGRCVVQAKDDQELYFAVVHGLGVVYLDGGGTVTCEGKKQIRLPK